MANIIKSREKEWRKPWISESANRNYLEIKGKPLVRLLAQTPLHTDFGDWTYMVFGDYATGKMHTVMVYGEVKGNRLKNSDKIIVRVHSSCATSEIFHSTNCECREELEEAMRRIRKAGRGIIVYLDQEGAGNGLVGKIRAYAMTVKWSSGKVAALNFKGAKPLSVYSAFKLLGYKSETRDFKSAAAMLKSLGVKSVKLMTNNPEKVRGLEDEGIKAIPYGIHIKPRDKVMAAHIRAKAEEMGHRINKTNWD
ncbi:MAG TPA: GTP cyclohydrolase II [Candidatus Acidoferrales bacterium]|nr:GTP cyclohydrolase II [Candidatus Acidoferrales bacterium]